MEAKGGQERPQRPGRRGLENLGLFGQAFEAKGRTGRYDLPDFGGGGFTPLLRMGLL